LGDSLREKMRRILEEIHWTSEAGVGVSEITEATDCARGAVPATLPHKS